MLCLDYLTMSLQLEFKHTENPRVTTPREQIYDDMISASRGHLGYFSLELDELKFPWQNPDCTTVCAPEPTAEQMRTKGRVLYSAYDQTAELFNANQGILSPVRDAAYAGLDIVFVTDHSLMGVTAAVSEYPYILREADPTLDISTALVLTLMTKFTGNTSTKLPTTVDLGYTFGKQIYTAPNTPAMRRSHIPLREQGSFNKDSLNAYAKLLENDPNSCITALAPTGTKDKPDADGTLHMWPVSLATVKRIIGKNALLVPLGMAFESTGPVMYVGNPVEPTSKLDQVHEIMEEIAGEMTTRTGVQRVYHSDEESYFDALPDQRVLIEVTTPD